MLRRGASNGQLSVCKIRRPYVTQSRIVFVLFNISQLSLLEMR
ncbi:hypothetical protein VPH234P10_0103 [Vibrio phage 234P10]